MDAQIVTSGNASCSLLKECHSLLIELEAVSWLEDMGKSISILPHGRRCLSHRAMRTAWACLGADHVLALWDLEHVGEVQVQTYLIKMCGEEKPDAARHHGGEHPYLGHWMRQYYWCSEP